MNQNVPIRIRAVVGINSGHAMFLEAPDKVFVIYVDDHMGRVLGDFMDERRHPRPLTHDLFYHTLLGFGVSVRSVVIHDVRGETFYARVVFRGQNEVLGTEKVVEVDARPRDALALALRCKCPMLVAQRVLDEVEDRTDAIEQYEREIREREAGDADLDA